jgi:penicillin-binding protein 2
MRLKKSQFLIIVLVALGVTTIAFWYLSKNDDVTTINPVATKSVFESIDGGLIFDRKNRLLVSASTTPGTQLLLNEVRSSLGKDTEVNLSVDSELQEYVYGALEDIAFNKGYEGAAGIVMDVQTGELLALTTYSQSETSLNKATNGLFIPGSIIKPFIAMAALSEDIVDPNKEILSTGSISLTDQNGTRLLFNDWKSHGYVDMRKALVVSSNVYFYVIGGGYEDQVGLGIDKITEYLQMFEIGNNTGIEVLTESKGQTPTPEWKRNTFDGDEWRLADTYLTSIGQHGYAVTPLQMVRAVGAIATEGDLVTPTILHDKENNIEISSLPLKKEHFKIVKEGMEYAVVNGTASGLYMDDVTLAAKTGTAEVDANKEHIHSWLIGYFPYDKPKYAFVFMLDTGPWGEETGAVSVAQNVFKWIRENRPEYVRTF